MPSGSWIHISVRPQGSAVGSRMTTPQGSILHQREALLPGWPLRPLAAWVDARLRPRLLTRLSEIRALLESA